MRPQASCPTPQEGGGVFIDGHPSSDPATLTSLGCDWGTGPEDNLPENIHIKGGHVFSYGENAFFTCDGDASVCL